MQRAVHLYVDNELCQDCNRCLAAEACKVRAFIGIDSDDPPFLDVSRCYDCRLCIPVGIEIRRQNTGYFSGYSGVITMVNQRLYELHASICKALGHPKRLEILDCLRAGELNVKELTEALAVSPSTLSRYLRTIHSTGIIPKRRDGQNVYYHLSDPRVIEACDAMRDVLLQNLETGAILAETIQK